PCATVICNPSYHCVDGSCEFEPCSGVSCSPGQSCAAGSCVADLCEGVVCPLGYACVHGGCVDDRQKKDLLAAGSGGFACNLSSLAEGTHSSPPIGLLVLLCLVLLRRRGGAR
ncbi:MAG: hypothetical protein JRH20_07480, partial [Deltaproteobacteria bacterium]|nr:hypothetical protein [Deltaproteobacteria bacterium]